MKFRNGDDTDVALSTALKHEFMRCDDSFSDFVAAAKASLVVCEDRQAAFKTYNAYARFIHHLYEFFLGAARRDRSETSQLSPELAEQYITSYAQRALTNRREAILNGTAPSWENHISYFPEEIPPSFAREFRRFRNVVAGHVLAERTSLDLSDFYERNHKFLGILYRSARDHWGRIDDNFPDLKQITAFSVMLKENRTGFTDASV
jgi:hypothetical protein